MIKDTGYELPHNWELATINDLIIDAQSGFASGEKNVPDGIRHLRMNNISSDCTLDMTNVRKVPEKLSSSKYILKSGDILFCQTNSTKLVGKTALFDLTDDNQYAFSNHLIRLRVSEVGPFPQWIWHGLTNLWRQRYFETRCKRWVNQATVAKETLLSAPILVPPLKEQKRIIRRVEELFQDSKKIQFSLERTLEILKLFHKTILVKVYSGELVKQDSREESAEKLINRLKIRNNEMEKRPLPNGWVWITVKDLGEIVTGNTPSKKNSEYYGSDFPFFKPTDLNIGYYVKQSREGLTKEGLKKARLIPAKSTLVTCIGATIGKSGFSRVDGTTNQQITSIIPNNNLVVPEFVYFIFITPQIYEDILGNASSTTIPIINKSTFEKISFPLPPIEEQKRIVKKIEKLFLIEDVIERSVFEAKKLAYNLEQSIIEKAFHGKLVPQDVNDESAKKLLEQIKLEKDKKHTKT